MSTPSPFAQSYCAFLKRARHGIFLFWFTVVILGLIWGRKFTGATTSQYTSAHDSDSAVAARKIAAHFPSSANSQSVTILLQQKGVAPTTADFLEQIQPVELGLYAACQQKYGYDVTTPCPDCFFRSMQSYWRKCIRSNYPCPGLIPALTLPHHRHALCCSAKDRIRRR